MRLASGIIRLAQLKQAGVQVGLGLDRGTNDSSDMFSNMRAAIGLQRVKLLSAATMPSVNGALRMATVDGAKLLNLDGQIGSLTPGKKADLIILNPEWVFVDGRVLKRRGQLVGVRPEAIVEAADEVANRIKKFLFP